MSAVSCLFHPNHKFRKLYNNITNIMLKIEFVFRNGKFKFKFKFNLIDLTIHYCFYCLIFKCYYELLKTIIKNYCNKKDQA